MQLKTVYFDTERTQILVFFLSFKVYQNAEKPSQGALSSNQCVSQGIKSTRKIKDYSSVCWRYSNSIMLLYPPLHITDNISLVFQNAGLAACIILWHYSRTTVVLIAVIVSLGGDLNSTSCYINGCTVSHRE